MRKGIFGLIVVVGLLGVPIAAGSVAGETSVATASSLAAGAQQQPPPPTGQIDVDIDTDEGGAWYTSPLWIAIGVIGLLVIVAIIIAASRGGGGTTVVRG